MPFLAFLGKMLLLMVVQVAAYALMPKPKGPKPDEVRDLEEPTAEAGKPIPVIFGEVTIKEYNFLWTGNKEVVIKEVD